ncbi:phospholipase D-like domain-containing protein [Azospirillum agricola]|uniref:phospholipase D-like domain-containing protein n=1 Tax=Azospirillum agricola TaxID=1720247 RepID=UPI000A0F2F5F|nr:phospholipase D-like domain-containing protein [Azospirillum agricola]SMH62587.1 Phosphatidylserine/phosphatidylglycerophosphate/cardiolipin synthase [Azospirillum lipoferum]
MRGEDTDFIHRLLRRRPELESDVKRKLASRQGGGPEGIESAAVAPETVEDALRRADMAAIETIVSEQRPVFFAARDAAGQPRIDRENAAIRGAEARFLKDRLVEREAVVAPLLDRIGRIDVEGIAGMPYVGTGWMIDDGIVVTNRHVAEVIARRSGQGYSFRMGAFGRPVTLSFATGHLHRDDNPGLSVPVASVLYIEPEDSDVDIAFLKLSARPEIGTLSFLPILRGGVPETEPLCVLGYPAKAPPRIIPDQALMRDLYRDVYDVKRVAPGFVARQEPRLITHDCTTLGGNSGSALVVMSTGEVAGLHFAGIYLRENQAVPASLLHDYRERRRWLRPPSVEARTGRGPATTATAPATTTITITVADGRIDVAVAAGAGLGGATGGAPPASAVEAAAAAFLREGPRTLVAARVGYPEDGQGDGGAPLIVASVRQSQLVESRDWPDSFRGVPVRYEAATLSEQWDARATDEAVTDIAYDDDARRGPEFRLEPVTEEMTVRAHLSPEHGLEEFENFLAGAGARLDAAMYEAQGTRIAEGIEGVLVRGVEVELTIDRRSAPKEPGEDAGEDTGRDAGDPLTAPVSAEFARWGREGCRFRYRVVPSGAGGLVASAYHIKVTVRDDDRFWLSSGNWKNGSSLPPVDEAMRVRATETDLPGNRDWHVVAASPTLSERFRSHIRQDHQRSGEPAGREAAASRLLVLVPAATEAVEERRPPSRVLPPLEVSGRIRAHPLLTPDRGGRIYSDAVLDLIRSARRTLLFQIPYIGMRGDPAVHRGNIDELIDALTEKLLTLDDARVLLRAGNSRFSDNRHVAWYLRSKGVDTDRCLRAIENHHAKGMVVDGERVLVGSHNWSSQGVSVNRDASVIFHDRRIAGYFAEAFEIDWDRSNRVPVKRFVREMPEILSFVGEAASPPSGFALRPLDEAMGDAMNGDAAG